MKIALFSFLPESCPACGARLHFQNTYARADFFAKCLHTCPGCGMKFQYVEAGHQVDTADAAGGDIRMWLERQ